MSWQGLGAGVLFMTVSWRGRWGAVQMVKAYGGRPAWAQANRLQRAARTLLVVLLAGVALLLAGVEPSQAGPAEAYRWRNVTIGGGGYVTGIAVHPQVRDLVYIRTDVGGAYRFSAAPDSIGRNWIPLTDAFTSEQSNYYGIESIAVDRQNPNVVYIAAGKYEWRGNGRIFKSVDRGQTWMPMGLEVPMSANGPARIAGERLAVDPYNPNVLYYGSVKTGLWRSTDGGTTWEPMRTPSAGEQPVGIPFVLPDPTRPAVGTAKSAPVYAGAFGFGLLESKDGGLTWTATGGPQKIMQGAIARDGTLFVTGPDGVHRLKGGVWENVTPMPGVEYCAIAVDPADPATLIVSEDKTGFDVPLHISRDSGRSWKVLSQATGSITAQPNIAWYWGFAGATSALAIDPHEPGRLWLTDWSGTWIADDYRSPKVTFRTLERGHEELVITTLIAPPKGAVVLSGAADARGFRHEWLDAFPPQFSDSGIWSTFGMDFQASNPVRIIRVGARGEHGDKAQGGVAVSSDNGMTWKPISWPFPEQPLKVAASASNPSAFVVLPRGLPPKRTLDGGQTWQDGQGVAEAPIQSYWHAHHPLASDRVRGGTFYLYSAGTFYRSDDSGLTWEAKSTLPVSGRVYVETEGDASEVVWVSLDDKGLFMSRDGGAHFKQLGSVKRAMLFSLGREKSYGSGSAVYLYGTVRDRDDTSIYRSDDAGRTWTEIADRNQPVGDEPTIMRGDRRQYGRVFVGTAGRGLFVGIPQ